MRQLKLVSPSFDVCLAAVRQLSEQATTAPAARALRTVGVAAAQKPRGLVFHPWRHKLTPGEKINVALDHVVIAKERTWARHELHKLRT